MVDRIFDRILTSLAILAAIAILYIVLSVDFEVISRYGFGQPTRWVVDYSEYALVFVLFLSAGWVLKEDSHVRIDILVNILPSRGRNILNAITSLVAMASCGIFTFYAANSTLESFHASVKIYQSMIVPQWPIWAVIPFGGLLLTLQFFRRTLFYVRGGAESRARKVLETR